MQRKPSRTPVKTFLIAAITGLALAALTGCYLGGGPFRHAFYGRSYPQAGYGYQSTSDPAADFHPETRGYGPMAGHGYRNGEHCGW
jgi:hypothetical protein